MDRFHPPHRVVHLHLVKPVDGHGHVTQGQRLPPGLHPCEENLVEGEDPDSEPGRLEKLLQDFEVASVVVGLTVSGPHLFVRDQPARTRKPGPGRTQFWDSRAQGVHGILTRA